ncbi:helix-turn-helix domain-containing protein, partial [Escherichia coli]
TSIFSHPVYLFLRKFSLQDSRGGSVAEFERDLLLERTHSGIVRARGAGKRFGRPPVLNEEQKQVVFERIKSGVSISAIAREFKTSRQTILRAKAKLQTPDI